jgi:hypothetical protein
LDEEFPDYQELMDDMAVDMIPVKLPCLPSMAAAPSASGQKRSSANPADGERDTKDTGASDNGIHHAAGVRGAADAALLLLSGPTGQEDLELSPDLVRANAVKAFVASPLLRSRVS